MLNSNNPYINQAYNKMTGSPSNNRQWRTSTGSNIPFEDPNPNFGSSGNPRIRSNNDIFGKTQKLMSSRLDDELYDYQMNSNRSNADLARSAQEKAFQNIMQRNENTQSIDKPFLNSDGTPRKTDLQTAKEQFEKKQDLEDFRKQQENFYNQIELSPQQKLQQRKDRIASQAYELSQARPNLEYQKQIDELTKQAQLKRLDDELNPPIQISK